MIQITLLAILAFPLFAITPEEVRKSVLDNFSLIEEAQFKLEAARAEETSARGSFDTKLIFKSRNKIEDRYDNQYFETTLERNTGVKGINLLAGHRQGVGTFPAYDGKYATSAAGELFAGISIPLLRNFSTDEARTNLELARLEKKQEEEQLRLKKNIYVHKALSLYYKFILEQQKLKIRNEILKLALDRNEMLEKKFSRGDIEKVKLTDNQRSIDKRKDELLKTEIALAELKAQLLIYLPGATENLSTIEPVETVVAPQLGSLKPEELPQVQILSLERDKNLALDKLRSQETLPGLSIDLLGAKELSQSPYDPESLQLGLKFDYPLENRKAEGKSVAQSYKLKAVEKRKAFVEAEITQSYEFTLRSVKLLSERLEILKNEEERTITMASAERNKWREGQSDLFTVNLREQDLADVEIRKWTTWYEFHQSILDAKLYNASI